MSGHRLDSSLHRAVVYGSVTHMDPPSRSRCTGTGDGDWDGGDVRCSDKTCPRHRPTAYSEVRARHAASEKGPKK